MKRGFIQGVSLAHDSGRRNIAILVGLERTSGRGTEGAGEGEGEGERELP